MNAQRESRSNRASRQARRNALIVFVVLTLVAVARMSDGVACMRSTKAELPARKRIPLEFKEIKISDGDTIRVRGHLIRFLGCDTPEMASSYFKGDQEPHASRSREFVVQSLRAARRIELVVVEHVDAHGRLLGHVFVDGESLSLRLVRAGMAYQTVSRFGHNGFESLAEEILAASHGVVPDFEDPAAFRHRNGK